MLGQLRPETALLIIPGEPSPSVDSVPSQESTAVANPQNDEKLVSKPENGFALPASAPAQSNATHGRRAQQIHIDEIELGDFILIPPGSIPPADGEIVDGTTTADESSLTGESVPVPKSLGDKLFTGTTNITSAVTVRVTKLGNETALQQIVRAVGDSLDHKAPIEELADRVTAVFVPIVVYMTLIVLAIWLAISLTPGTVPLDWFPNDHPQTADRVFFAFQFAIALLAIACPCGIGLAAPAAQAVGAGMAVKAGILAQGGGTAFQLASQVDTVVFDKTGTLTKGTPEVVTAEMLRDHDWILEAVRLIEEGSTHPLAAALVKYANSKIVETRGELRVLEMEEVAGRGTKGRLRVDGRTMSFKLGSEAFMEGVILPLGYNSATTQSWKRRGYSVIILSLSCLDSSSTSAIEQLSIAARFAVSDPPRDEAAGVIASLKRSGKSVWMLSGDNETTARAVGHELGIEPSNVKAGVLPQEKSAFIQELKEQVVINPRRWGSSRKGKAVVMFAGDGLNDSAAIAAADVGVAFSHGSQVTLANASFVLLQTKAPLKGIGELLKLSKKVYRRQKVSQTQAEESREHY
jgi:Cu+-exporting ATPase